jgi:N-acylglucosamine-6-phosphate 2-epimerase
VVFLETKRSELFERIRDGLIVSCQALRHEPLYGSETMAKMAVAAMRGGAAGIRANSVLDINSIRQAIDLPIIGLIKQEYPDSPVYITPTLREVEALAESGADIIAMDATDRQRPGGGTIASLFPEIRRRFPNSVFMADCATLDDGLRAEALGFDCVGTTMSGYTQETSVRILPDYDLMRALCGGLSVPVIGEGGIWSPEQLARAFEQGVHCVVVGTAITRPMDITRRFVAALPQRAEKS